MKFHSFAGTHFNACLSLSPWGGSFSAGCTSFICHLGPWFSVFPRRSNNQPSEPLCVLGASSLISCHLLVSPWVTSVHFTFLHDSYFSSINHFSGYTLSHRPSFLSEWVYKYEWTSWKSLNNKTKKKNIETSNDKCLKLKIILFVQNNSSHKSDLIVGQIWGHRPWNYHV